MTLKAMHFKFAITESPTIEPAAAPVPNGDLAVAAFMTASRDIVAIMTLHYISKHICSMEDDGCKKQSETKKKNKKVGEAST